MEIGKKMWLIPGGNIPSKSTGREPEMLSQDRVSVLNTNKQEVEIELEVVYGKQEAVKGFKLKVGAERLRCFRVNDLIDPLPIYLDKAYGLKITASLPVVVQFLRMDTRAAEVSIMGTMAFGTD